MGLWYMVYDSRQDRQCICQLTARHALTYGCAVRLAVVGFTQCRMKPHPPPHRRHDPRNRGAGTNMFSLTARSAQHINRPPPPYIINRLPVLTNYRWRDSGTSVRSPGDCRRGASQSRAQGTSLALSFSVRRRRRRPSN